MSPVPPADVEARLKSMFIDADGTSLRREDLKKAEVQKRSAPIVEDWIKKASAKGVDAAKILTEFRAELKKVAAEK